MAGTPDANGTHRGTGAVFPLVLMILLGLGAGASFPFALSENASGAAVSIHLYGSAASGWSTAPGGETNPGPTLVVNTGDQVEVTLTSEDGLQHGLFIDYNKNGVVDSSDFVSPTTTSTITFTLTAGVSGTFTYYCRVHSVPYDPAVSLMRGKWVTNTAPSASITSPAAATSWTGGVAHDVAFTASDAEGDPLEAVLTYTYNGGVGQGTIKAAFPPGPNPNVVSWTPSGFTAADTIVHLRVTDNRGGATTIDSAPFGVDSTAPQISASSPGPGATQVGLTSRIWVTWTEGMNKEATGAPSAFGVRVVDGAWQGRAVSWSSDGKQMTFTPARSLEPATTYEVRVNNTARDDSDPGNAFAGPQVWTFTTSSTVDQTPPTILGLGVAPVLQIPGGSVNLTADVQDDIGIGGVTAVVIGPTIDSNLTMTHASGTRWYLDRPYSEAGHYNVTVWATDTSGNAVSGVTMIEIASGPPGARPDLPAPGSVSAVVLDDGRAKVRWAPVTGTGLAGYHVYRGSASGSAISKVTQSPIPSSAPPEYLDGTVQPGETYTYAVTSLNTTGFESAYSQAFTVSIPAFHESPLFDPIRWAVAGVSIAVVMGALYGLGWRRKPT